MKNSLIACLLLLAALCACNQHATPQKRIAILTPVSHPSLEQIEKGFVQTLQAAHPERYRFDIFNAQGNKTLMRSEIEEIIRGDYELVFTLGTTASQMAIEVFGKKGLTTPVVFTCVNDPVGFHIAASEKSSGNMATGVREIVDFQKEILYLLQYKPEIKRLLLVYNPTEPGLGKDQQELFRLSQERHIELTTVEVFQTNELMAKVQPFITKTDAVIVLKDNTVICGIDALVKLCNRYQVPLIASDLDSPDKGAAFGYGVHEVDFGIEAAHKALLILDEGMQPKEIPITPVSQFTLRINEEAALKQGVAYDRLHP